MSLKRQEKMKELQKKHRNSCAKMADRFFVLLNKNKILNEQTKREASLCMMVAFFDMGWEKASEAMMGVKNERDL